MNWPQNAENRIITIDRIFLIFGFPFIFAARFDKCYNRGTFLKPLCFLARNWRQAGRQTGEVAPIYAIVVAGEKMIYFANIFEYFLFSAVLTAS